MKRAKLPKPKRIWVNWYADGSGYVHSSPEDADRGIRDALDRQAAGSMTSEYVLVPAPKKAKR